MNELVELITCRQCSQQKPASPRTPHWCVDCEKAYNNRYSFMRSQNADWMEVAKENGLELYEKQPGETQLEWSIWLAYRDSYPGAKPSYKGVAEKVNSTYDFVRKTAARWHFQTRMQAWIVYCDQVTLAQRRQEILDMNKDHITMATMLRKKLNEAIENINPLDLKPGEINGLTKTMAELERKARMDTMAVEAQRADSFVDADNPELRKSPTKTDDMSEVLSILLKAGALGDVGAVGVRTTETKTTEVVIKGDE